MFKTLRASITCAILMGCSISTAANESWVSLFNGSDLTGWSSKGGSAQFIVEDGVIVGTAVEGTPNTFLTTEQTFSDFILEYEAKVDSPLNSGVQIRSQFGDNRVFGPQVEIDPSVRGWTGGIYSEAHRNWLYPVTRNPKGQTAYIPNEWNSFRVEAIGHEIRTWVNGIPVANLVDDDLDSGFIGLQVHSIRSGQNLEGLQSRFRNIRIQTENLEEQRWHMPDSVPEFSYLVNVLTPRQKAEGWKLLFDGKTSNGWRGAKLDHFPTKGWKVENGELTVLSSGGGEARNGGDIITTEEFSSFELEVDFKITEAANSGIKYFVDPNLLKGQGSAIGLEFQILDDKKHPDAKKGVNGNRTISSLYDLITAGNLSEPNRDTKRFFGIGKWNRARIVVKGSKVEHWLNNVKTVEYDRHSQIFRALVAYSKYQKWPNFGEWEKGPILLQDHGDHVSFRSIKIRKLEK